MRIHEDPKNRSAAVLHKLADFSGKRMLEIGCDEVRLTIGFGNEVSNNHIVPPRLIIYRNDLL